MAIVNYFGWNSQMPKSNWLPQMQKEGIWKCILIRSIFIFVTLKTNFFFTFVFCVISFFFHPIKEFFFPSHLLLHFLPTKISFFLFLIHSPFSSQHDVLDQYVFAAMGRIPWILETLPKISQGIFWQFLGFIKDKIKEIYKS